MLGNTVTISNLLESIKSAVFIESAMPWIILIIGFSVTIFAIFELEKIFEFKKPKDIEGDLHRQNYISAIQIDNDEVLKYEEKMGEGVGTTEDLINLRRTDRM